MNTEYVMQTEAVPENVLGTPEKSLFCKEGDEKCIISKKVLERIVLNVTTIFCK